MDSNPTKMKSLSFFGLKILPNGEFRNLFLKMQALEHDNEEALKYLGIIAQSKSQVIPPATNGKSSEVVKRLSSFQAEMAKLIHSSEQARWHDAGIGQFNELLNQYFNNQHELFEKIVSMLARYVNANQVALFVVQDINDHRSKIILEACYAYDRKKYIDKAFDREENLIGQSLLERSTIFLTNVPQFYTKITSGLGEATPGCILIVPLHDDKNCIGALELAAFRKFSDLEIRFVEHLAKSLTVAVLNIKQTKTLKELITRANIAQNSVKEKDEEIRQQMEELQATNEQINRKSVELEQMKIELERKNHEIQMIREQEKQLLESKLDSQKNSYELIIDRLKSKLKQNNPL